MSIHAKVPLFVLIGLFGILANAAATESACDPERDQKENSFAACGVLSNAKKSGLALENSILDHLRGLRIDFSQSDLSMSRLNFANLRECSGKKTNFTGLRAHELKLVGGSYAYANFTGASLERCEFRGVFAPFTHFTRANLKGCKFIRSYLVGAKWTDTVLQETEFIESLGGPLLR